MSVRFHGDAGPIASPGQALVFYRDDEVLGGGTITEVRRHALVDQAAPAD
jgi:tRNA U34 2-thiouridine synthase MnmA/TrmU